MMFSNSRYLQNTWPIAGVRTSNRYQ